MRAAVEPDSPPPRAGLNALRWRFARTLLRHLPHKDRLVYARLRCHADPAVAATARRYADEAALLYERFDQHSSRWTPDAVDADWSGYRNSVRQMTRMLEDRVARENRELLPWLDTAPEITPVQPFGGRNWAGDGWKLRAMLGMDDPEAATG